MCLFCTRTVSVTRARPGRFKCRKPSGTIFDRKIFQRRMCTHISRFLYNNNIDPFECYAHFNIRILTARAGARNDVRPNRTTDGIYTVRQPSAGAESRQPKPFTLENASGNQALSRRLSSVSRVQIITLVDASISVKKKIN